ncbi:hypothetical protein Nepgr_023251 [Nepenthes gracilis]|uniref:Uncharacterized protein n=1 Tax=Nepenthes gracilis TaxID=150966 RepID=A0AAD3T2J0_NEPGR|nr:hypothetical protein Nepgr_023251 [Nepenthes gracilis]
MSYLFAATSLSQNQSIDMSKAPALYEDDHAWSLKDTLDQTSVVLNGSHEPGRMPSITSPIIQEDSGVLVVVNLNLQPQVFAQK